AGPADTEGRDPAAAHRAAVRRPVLRCAAGDRGAAVPAAGGETRPPQRRPQTAQRGVERRDGDDRDAGAGDAAPLRRGAGRACRGGPTIGAVDLAYLRAHPEHLPAFLTHQRIRETPVSGGSICVAQRLTLEDGASVFAKSLDDAPPGFFAAEAA